MKNNPPLRIRRVNGSFFALFIIMLSVSMPGGIVTGAAEVPDDETCLGCHDGYESGLRETAHRLASEVKAAKSTVSCAGCHEGGAVHIEDPSTDNIGNPARMSGHEAQNACGTCHQAHQELDNYGFDAHSMLELNCSACHKVHGGKPALLVDEGTNMCLICHDAVGADLKRRSQHPVRQGNLTCLSCHRFTKRADENVVYGHGRTCQNCHPEQGGPFLYEHDPVNAWAVDGGGCLECHESHGSENDRLLSQPSGELCRSCHIGHTGGRHADLWANAWSRLDCRTCHSQTHGSFTSEKFLDPALGAKLGFDCYSAGCHTTSGQGGF